MSDVNSAAITPPANAAAEGKNAQIVYILYLVGIVIGLAGIAGVIMAYVNKGTAPEWVQAHYRYLIRTFWIELLFGVIGVVTAVFIIGWIILLATAIWLIIRCVKGMQALSAGQPPKNVTTWWF